MSAEEYGDNNSNNNDGGNGSRGYSNSNKNTLIFTKVNIRF